MKHSRFSPSSAVPTRRQFTRTGLLLMGAAVLGPKVAFATEAGSAKELGLLRCSIKTEVTKMQLHIDIYLTNLTNKPVKLHHLSGSPVLPKPVALLTVGDEKLALEQIVAPNPHMRSRRGPRPVSFLVAASKEIFVGRYSYRWPRNFLANPKNFHGKAAEVCVTCNPRLWDETNRWGGSTASGPLASNSASFALPKVAQFQRPMEQRQRRTNKKNRRG